MEDIEFETKARITRRSPPAWTQRIGSWHRTQVRKQLQSDDNSKAAYAGTAIRDHKNVKPKNRKAVATKTATERMKGGIAGRAQMTQVRAAPGPPVSYYAS